MIWHKLLGSAPRAIRQIWSGPPRTLCGGSALELTELEERILMSATPLAPDLLPDADISQSPESHDGGHDGGHDGAHEAAATESVTLHDLSDGAWPTSTAADDLPSQSDHVASERHEVVFVDTAVTGYQELLAHLADQHNEAGSLDIILLDHHEEGIQQITRALEQYEQLDAVRFLSHGNDGSVRLGSTWLDADHLTAYAGEIATWSNALAPHADILFYSCDLAASPEGVTLLEAIHALTGADVAASVDATGHADLHGNWTLEHHVGSIETHELMTAEAREQWYHILSSGYVRDSFHTGGFAGNVGTHSWTGSWHELGESDGPGWGNVRVVYTDFGWDLTHCLAINGVGGAGAYREVDLSDAISATLSFDYKRSFVGSSALLVQVSADGGASWTTLDSITASKSMPATYSYDMSAYADSHTQIRFSVSTNGGATTYLDNVRIDFELLSNNAPILDIGDSLTLSDILEDQFDNPGTSVAAILASGGNDRIIDPDAASQEGIAVTGVDDTHGQWQYDANASGDWQAFGAVSDTSAVLLGTDSLVRFVPVADFSGPAGAFQFRAWDHTTGSVGDIGCDVSINGGSTAFSTETDSASITVLAVNDAPVLTLPGDLSVAEDTDLAITGLSVADVDSGSGELQVTLSVEHGQLMLGTTAGLTFTTGDGTGDPTLVFTGSLEDLNAALGSLTYRPDLDYYGSDAISVVVDDQGNTGAGGPLSDSGSVDLTITPVNDAPVLTLPGDLSVAEDTDLAITGLSVADVDSGSGELQVTLSVAHGQLMLGTTTGLTFTTGDGAGDPTLVFTGSLSDLNAALSSLTYRPDLDYHGSDAIAVVVDDLGNTGAGGPLSDCGSVDLTITPVNDAPTSKGFAIVEVDEDAPRSRIDLFAVFDDVEQPAETLEYTIVDIVHPELFARVAVDQTHGWLILDYAPNMFGSAAITVCARDAEGQSVTDVLTVVVHPVNDAPVSSPNSYTIRADQTLVVSAPGVLINDTDVDGDVLSAILVRGPQSGTLILNADGSFTYVPVASYSGLVTFSYRATDGEEMSQHTLVAINVTSAINAVEFKPDVAEKSSAATDDKAVPQTPDTAVDLISQDHPHLALLSYAELPSAVVQDDEAAPARIHAPQRADDPAGDIDDSAAFLNQESWTSAGSEAHAYRAVARDRSGDDGAEMLMRFIETVALPAAQEVVAPVIAIAQSEVADLSTLLHDDSLFHRWMIGSAVGVTTGLTVGYVFWTVRAGYLLTGLVAQVPAWRFVDPLPILNSLGGEAVPGDGESLASIAESGRAEPAA